MTRIRKQEPGQRIELIASRRRKVVANVVGRLFGKPDRVVRSDLNTHDPMVPMRRRQVLEGLGTWVKDDQRVLAHGTEPDLSMVVNGWSHHLVIRPRVGILSEGSPCCQYRHGHDRSERFLLKPEEMLARDGDEYDDAQQHYS